MASLGTPAQENIDATHDERAAAQQRGIWPIPFREIAMLMAKLSAALLASDSDVQGDNLQNLSEAIFKTVLNAPWLLQKEIFPEVTGHVMQVVNRYSPEQVQVVVVLNQLPTFSYEEVSGALKQLADSKLIKSDPNPVEDLETARAARVGSRRVPFMFTCYCMK